MRIGSLHIRLAPRRRAVLAARFDAAACRECLARLAQALAGQPWMVVSGLVQPLLDGRFTRTHSDVDIAIPLSHLDSLASAAAVGGYAMTTRVLRTHLSRDTDLELHLRVGAGDLLLRRRPNRLRLWRLGASGDLDEHGFPPYVDVFAFVARSGELRILDGDHRLPLARPLVREIRLPDGALIPVEDPSYLQALHRQRSLPSASLE